MEREARRQALQRLVARIDPDAFADQVLDVYWSREDAAAFREPRRHAHMWVRWNLDLFMRWVMEDRPPTEADLEVLRARASAQAQDGAPADLVPGNFRRAARFAWNAALAVAGESERVALLESADLLFEYVDQVSRIYAEAHAQAALSASIGVGERRARGCIRRLSDGEPPDAEDIELASGLGLRLEGPFRPMIIALRGGGHGPHLSLAERLRDAHLLAAAEGPWVKALSNGRSLREGPSLPAQAVVAEGNLTTSQELERVLDELRLLAQIARGCGRSGFVEPHEHLGELLLATSPRIAAQVRHRVYGPLRAHGELARTLDQLVQHDFNHQRAAAALPVHRNTFRERIARIAELTGMTFRSSEERGLAWLAHLQAPADLSHSS